MENHYNYLLIGMALLAAVVFVSLYFVNAGYGMMISKRWGPVLPNRWGWMLMESPVFMLMILLWACSDRMWEPTALCFFLFFELHYFQRSFVFPFLIRGDGRMPLSIMGMAFLFNLLNALMQGGWIFYVAPEGYYTSVNWFTTPQFIVGTLLFFVGMGINIHSDSIIRNLRKPGDTKHYLPRKGLFRYVSSANYFGELIEWCGFALLTWSFAGAVFAWWTFANLAPRAHAIHRRYSNEFGEEFKRLNPKRIIPFIY
ncbi:DUF1295 domain-containing protein [Porphyromonadaceae bacterium]